MSGKSFPDYLDSDSDISFISSGRPSGVRPSSVFYDYMDAPRISVGSDRSFASTPLPYKSIGHSSPDLSSLSQDEIGPPYSYTSQNMVIIIS